MRGVLALEPRRGPLAFLRDIFPFEAGKGARGREPWEFDVLWDLRHFGPAFLRRLTAVRCLAVTPVGGRSTVVRRLQQGRSLAFRGLEVLTRLWRNRATLRLCGSHVRIAAQGWLDPAFLSDVPEFLRWSHGGALPPLLDGILPRLGSKGAPGASRRGNLRCPVPFPAGVSVWCLLSAFSQLFWQDCSGTGFSDFPRKFSIFARI